MVRKHPTIWDVAALAKVSKSTVSYVIRGSPRAGAETRKRVEAAIAELGYRPNAIARQLVERRPTTVGVLLRDLANPFDADMARLVERGADALGLVALFNSTDGDRARETRAIGTMLEQRVAGIVFLSEPAGLRAIQQLIRGTVPSVCITCKAWFADSVSVDDAHGGRLATEHLLELGHRSLSFLLPGNPDRADRARRHGFGAALLDAGLGSGSVIRWDRERAGRSRTHITKALLGPQRVTGVIAANDFAAIDLIDFADSQGVAVPDELSVVGFDDISLAGLGRIGLTTVSQPREELVFAGLEMLMARINGSLQGPPRSTSLPVRLVVRRSTAPPPAARQD